MAIYSEDSIEEVINSNDIVDIVSGYVQLKRAGRNYMGLCPFHREKTPSFVVSPDKQIYHCFGCGQGGNVLGFIMKLENLEFVDALEFLANRAGIDLKPIKTNFVDKNKDIKDRIYAINLEAANHFYMNLYSTKGKEALEYLYKRKLDDNTIKKFGLGYSNNTNEMFEFLKSKGFTEDEILKSAIVEKKENRYVDKFRNRLMFPITDIRDRVIAFGGRVMDDSKPKYINSPETLVYSKGKTLFALNIAKREKLDKVLIVEGYMDTISLHQRGISNVIASLGTALTQEQAKLIRKYTTNVIISYDSDSAGQAATLRGLDILNSVGCEVKVLKLDADDVKDPDEYIIKYGSGRFNKVIENALTLVEFKLQLLINKFNLDKVDEKIKFLNEMANVLASISNDIERDVYVNKISKMTGISVEPINAEINKLRFKYESDLKNVNVSRPIIPVNRANIKKDLTLTDKVEKYIIFLLLEKDINIYDKLKEKIKVENIRNDKYRDVVRKLYEYYESNSNNDIMAIFEEDEMNIITSTICLNYSIDNIDKTIDDIYKTVKKTKLLDRKQEILEKLKENQVEGKEELEKELSDILISLSKI